MLKLLLLVIIHDVILSTGQTLIKRGMNTAEDVKLTSLRSILRFIGFCVTHGTILSGLAFNTISLIIWLTVLSFADLSLAYPFDSLHYIVIAFFAMTFLKEEVRGLRWVGILLIVAGVTIVGLK